MQIRSYRQQDLHALYALDTACFAPPFRFSRAMMRRCAEGRGAVVRLAVEDLPGSSREELLGFVIAQLETEGDVRVGYLATLDVAVAARRRGIGRTLLHCAETEVARLGALAMGLHVYSGNNAAIAMYEAMGYVRTGVQRGYYGRGLDAFAYRKAWVSDATGSAASQSGE